MLATSRRTGNRAVGSIVVRLDGLAHGYRYTRSKRGGVESLTVTAHGGALAVGPLGSVLSTIAADTASARDPGPHGWEIKVEAGEYVVRPVAAGEVAA
jgi:hypothetical protein